MNLLLTILVIVLVVWACFWIIDRAIPGTPNTIAKVVVGVIGVLSLLTNSGLV